MIDKPSIAASAPPRAPFRGGLIALGLLALVEVWLHTDSFLVRYRAVFAAGRAMDKIVATDALRPHTLILGNSRVDNGVIPAVLRAQTGQTAFNLGIPGAGACTLFGVGRRLVERDVLGTRGVRQTLIGLDDAVLQPSVGLGYEVFFESRRKLMEQGRYADLAKSWLRLWGYAESLKTLQEPAKLLRFVAASTGSVEPWGGAVRETLGHRAADDVQNQDAAQLAAQERDAAKPLDTTEVSCLIGLIELLKAQDVQVFAFYPPTLHRPNAFLAGSEAPPEYDVLRRQLRTLGVVELPVDNRQLMTPENFANAGHLGRRGAELYSAAIASRLGSALGSATPVVAH